MFVRTITTPKYTSTPKTDFYTWRNKMVQTFGAEAETNIAHPVVPTPPVTSDESFDTPDISDIDDIPEDIHKDEPLEFQLIDGILDIQKSIKTVTLKLNDVGTSLSTHIKQTDDNMNTVSDTIQTTSDKTQDILDDILSELKKANAKEITAEEYNLSLNTILSKLKDYEIQQLTDRRYFEVLAQILELQKKK